MDSDLFKESTIETRGIKDVVYELLKKNIITGQLKPEERLIEKQIAKEFNVSRTPLREAIQKLEREGWVKRVASGGVKVTAISVQELTHLSAVRVLLEGLAVREATALNGTLLKQKLKNILDEAIHYTEMGNSEQVVRLGKQFHQAFIDLCENPICVDFLTTINERLDRYRMMGLIINPNRNKQSFAEHMEIYNAVSAGSAEEAEKLMQSHIRESWKIVAAKLSQKKLGKQ